MALAKRMLTGAAAVLALAACSGKDSAPVADSAAVGGECVPIADGVYTVQDGKLLVMKPADAETAVPDASTPATPGGTLDTPVGWAAILERSFEGQGYPWMGLQVRNRVAVLTGTAPGLAARDVSFIAGKAAIEGDDKGAQEVDLIVNAMSVEGREDNVGAGLASLMNGQLSMADCQDAFDRTMRDDDIDFPVNTATISAAELPVLDAATGIARLCSAYRIEIAEHTDSLGSDSYNLQLSRQRADAVKAYMVEHGVDESVLKAAGYGEAQPIDPANTPEARARNERTEFHVSER